MGVSTYAASAPALEGRDGSRLAGGMLFFLLGTLLCGVLFRWQLAGWAGWSAGLDLRRAHSHLGFYGVLFPLTWKLLSGVGAPVPRQGWLAFYLGMVAASGIGFLWQGYGLLSIASSTGVLLVWLVFAWQNRGAVSVSRREWLGTITPSVLLSSMLIMAVAVTTRRNPALANQLARVFLTLLLFGVAVPATLRTLGGVAPRPGPWILASIAGAISLTGLLPGGLFSLGLVWLGLAILNSISKRDREKPAARTRTALHWGFFAVTLMATGARLLPHTHPIAIAGIHYLILGPVLMSFADSFKAPRSFTALRALYEACLLGMVSCIALQEVLTGHYLLLQQGAAAFGTLLVGLMAWICARSLYYWKGTNGSGRISHE